MTDPKRIIATLQGRLGQAKSITIGRVLARGIILTLTEQQKEIEMLRAEKEVRNHAESHRVGL